MLDISPRQTRALRCLKIASNVSLPPKIRKLGLIVYIPTLVATVMSKALISIAFVILATRNVGSSILFRYIIVLYFTLLILY